MLLSMGSQRVGHDFATEQDELSKVGYMVSTLKSVMFLLHSNEWYQQR